MYSKIEDLIGKTLTSIKVADDKETITFDTSDGDKYQMIYYQDCCASCSIDEINGDLEDLLNSPIIKASENSNSDQGAREDYDDSYTWTFYDLATIKGSVQIKWYGSSNGYYSESATFEKIN